MKQILVLIFVISISGNIFSQEKKLYNPKADGMKQLDSALVSAKEQNKHVIVQIGGNWCQWCFIYNDFVNSNSVLDSIMNKNYIQIHVNYDGKKESFHILERLDYPQRFGFPVLVITDADGKRLHTQNTWYLEEGNSYGFKKVEAFLNSWTPKAVSPETYTKNP